MKVKVELDDEKGSNYVLFVPEITTIRQICDNVIQSISRSHIISKEIFVSIEDKSSHKLVYLAHNLTMKELLLDMDNATNYNCLPYLVLKLHGFKRYDQQERFHRAFENMKQLDSLTASIKYCFYELFPDKLCTAIESDQILNLKNLTQQYMFDITKILNAFQLNEPNQNGGVDNKYHQTASLLKDSFSTGDMMNICEALDIPTAFPSNPLMKQEILQSLSNQMDISTTEKVQSNPSVDPSNQIEQNSIDAAWRVDTFVVVEEEAMDVTSSVNNLSSIQTVEIGATEPVHDSMNDVNTQLDHPMVSEDTFSNPSSSSQIEASTEKTKLTRGDTKKPSSVIANVQVNAEYTTLKSRQRNLMNQSDSTAGSSSKSVGYLAALRNSINETNLHTTPSPSEVGTQPLSSQMDVITSPAAAPTLDNSKSNEMNNEKVVNGTAPDVENDDDDDSSSDSSSSSSSDDDDADDSESSGNGTTSQEKVVQDSIPLTNATQTSADSTTATVGSSGAVDKTIIEPVALKSPDVLEIFDTPSKVTIRVTKEEDSASSDESSDEEDLPKESKEDDDSSSSSSSSNKDTIGSSDSSSNSSSDDSDEENPSHQNPVDSSTNSSAVVQNSKPVAPQQPIPLETPSSLQKLLIKPLPLKSPSHYLPPPGSVNPSITSKGSSTINGKRKLGASQTQAVVGKVLQNSVQSSKPHNFQSKSTKASFGSSNPMVKKLKTDRLVQSQNDIHKKNVKHLPAESKSSTKGGPK